jgi:hypothetical protein
MTVVATLVAAGLFILLHWQGIGLSGDGWALWQASVSLGGGHGYRTFSGEQIVSWPPLYSAYLSLWNIPFGPTGAGLVAANGVLIVGQAWLWSRLIDRLIADDGLALPPRVAMAVGVFVGTFIAVNQAVVLSHNLVYLLLPIYLWGLWSFSRQQRPMRDTATLVTAGTLLLMAHNSCIAFVAAAAVVMASRPMSLSKPGQLMLSAMAIGIPVILWAALRHLLGQMGSHSLGWDVGRYGAGDYVLQLLSGPGNLLVSERYCAGLVGWIVLCAGAVLLARASQTLALRFALIFVIAASAMLFVLFNISWIYDDLSRPRFVLFAPLLLLPLIVRTAMPRYPAATVILTALLLVPQLYWAGIWAHRQLGASLSDLDFPRTFVSHTAYISRNHLDGDPVTTPKGVLIAAPRDVEPASLIPPERRTKYFGR